ncbi:hypothetical protein M3686_04795 [Micrococcus luteus]|uniref:hypothetical protein n=1 Tax=Micrococcus luteus TaxID=1270 RepID=UPI002040ABC7|nr:hypothetical protein [Micrococcus luteus]MCM3577452.1 hypothetical protein [Micrococcus luteus]
MSRPEVLIDDEVISGSARAPLVTLGELSIKWGNESVLDGPKPSTATVAFRFRSDVEAGKISLGRRLIIRQRIDGKTWALFAGTIRSMRARTDAQGRLSIHVTAADSLRDFMDAYAQLEWPSDSLPDTTKQIELIRKTMAALGWELKGDEDLAPPLYPSSSSFYSSITLYTVLRRYLAQYGPQVTFWDSSGTDMTTGVYTRSIQVGFMGRSQVGDTLTANPTTGQWYVTRDTPDGLVFDRIPASRVLRDVEWAADTGSILTVANVSYQSTRTETDETGETRKITSMVDVSTQAAPELVERYGRRAIDVETSVLAPPAEQRRIGRKWLEFATDEWRPGALTIPDTHGMDESTLAGLLPSTTRRRRWWVITDVGTWTPHGGPATLRGVATGGELRYHPTPKAGRSEGHWEVSMSLTDTQVILPADWTFTQLQGTEVPFSQATADQAGAVSFAEFQTITRTYAQ